MKGAITYLLFMLLLLFSRGYAQSFQWGKRAGSAQTTGGSEWEHVNSMAVDVHGNVYAVGHVAQASVNVDGDVKNGNGAFDVVLASFDCHGSLRWWKVIGGPSKDYGFEVCTDKLDGVYISCLLDRSQGGNTIHIDSDTTFSGKTNKCLSLIKYDTAGNYKWLSAPQADTISLNTYINTGDLGLNVDSAGNVYWMLQMAASVYFYGTLNVPQTSDYILQYDRSGNFNSALNLKSMVAGGRLTRDTRSGRFYYAGYGNTSTMNVNGVPLSSSKYIAAFDKTGKYIWCKQGDAGDVGGVAGTLGIDGEGSIYAAMLLDVGETFNGFKDKLSSIYISPTVIKMDSNGNVLWGVEAKTNAATFVDGGITLRNSGEVLLHGKFPGLLKWQDYDDSFNLPKNSGYRPFITRFNTTTGKVLGIDQLPASGCEEYATVSDGRDNVYIGGNFYTTLTVAGNTLVKVGGESDWYLAKYGHSNCNCTNIPEPQFSMTKTGQTANFTYTGSSGISTYRWDFGDGDTATTASPTHNYKDSGSYIVCLKVTNSCGDNTYCRQVYLFPNSIANVLSAGDISYTLTR